MFNFYYGILTDEFRYIFTDRIMRRIFILAPLFIAFIMGMLYYRGEVIDMPTAIVDLDNSSLSREIVSGFESHPRLKIVSKGSNYNEMKDLIYHGKAQVAVVIPDDLEEKACRGLPSEVLIIIDGSNLLFANNGLTATSEVVNRLSAILGVKLLARSGYFGSEAAGALSRMTFTEQAWYNPGFNYAQFLVFGFIMYCLQQTLLIGTVVSVSRVKGSKRGRLILLDFSGLVQMVMRLLPYLLIALLQFSLIMVAGNRFLGLPIYGSILLLFFITLLFFMVLILFGALCAQLATPLNAVRYAMTMALPSIALSGYTWPLGAMPVPVRYLAYCLPLTWYLESLRAIIVRAAGWSTVSRSVVVMLVMLLIMVFSNWLVRAFQLHFGKNVEQVMEVGGV